MSRVATETRSWASACSFKEHFTCPNPLRGLVTSSQPPQPRNGGIPAHTPVGSLTPESLGVKARLRQPVTRRCFGAGSVSTSLQTLSFGCRGGAGALPHGVCCWVGWGGSGRGCPPPAPPRRSPVRRPERSRERIPRRGCGGGDGQTDLAPLTPPPFPLSQALGQPRREDLG